MYVLSTGLCCMYRSALIQIQIVKGQNALWLSSSFNRAVRKCAFSDDTSSWNYWFHTNQSKRNVLSFHVCVRKLNTDTRPLPFCLCGSRHVKLGANELLAPCRLPGFSHVSRVTAAGVSGRQSPMSHTPLHASFRPY